MKEVEATIQQHKLDAVKNALQVNGVEGLTITEVHHVGGATRTMTYRGVTRTVDVMPFVRVEAIVADRNVEAVIDAILQQAQTGTAGDGTIAVSDVNRVIRIRTGETDAADAEVARNQVGAVGVPSQQSRWDVPSYQHSW